MVIVLYFEFNKNKSFRHSNNVFALFSNFSYAFIISVACYAISNLILVFLDTDIDVVSLSYVSIFGILFLIINFAFDILYYKTKKGLTITNTEIIITNGYFERFQDFRIKIKLSEIESVDYVEQLSIKELKKDYKNYNYGWITIGVGLKKVPVLKITTNDEHPKIYFIACENISEIIDIIE